MKYSVTTSEDPRFCLDILMWLFEFIFVKVAFMSELILDIQKIWPGFQEILLVTL